RSPEDSLRPAGRRDGSHGDCERKRAVFGDRDKIKGLPGHLVHHRATSALSDWARALTLKACDLSPAIKDKD
ncbi:MAG: hypothetical protein M1493_05735, partial [Firmicutes bacterium]|nr:hypothetical protein [Bacillota bacterium]